MEADAGDGRPEHGDGEVRQMQPRAADPGQAVAATPPAYLVNTPEQTEALRRQAEAIARGEIPVGVSMTPEQVASLKAAVARGDPIYGYIRREDWLDQPTGKTRLS